MLVAAGLITWRQEGSEVWQATLRVLACLLVAK
jgi:hypothetical protein